MEDASFRYSGATGASVVLLLVRIKLERGSCVGDHGRQADRA